MIAGESNACTIDTATTAHVRAPSIYYDKTTEDRTQEGTDTPWTATAAWPCDVNDDVGYLQELLEDIADSRSHILQRGMAILIIIQHPKRFGCMLGIQKMLQILWKNVVPASSSVTVM